jgi:hypothetical protein
MIELDDRSPLWLYLLRYQRYALGKTGLTIPFLVGAAQPQTHSGLVESDAYVAMATLLTAFRDQVPRPYRISISECNLLHVPVVSLCEPNYSPPDCQGLFDPSGRETLLVERAYFAKRKHVNIEAAIEGLLALVIQALSIGRFSFREGQYVAFSSTDLKFIEDARQWRRQAPLRRI